MDIRALFPQPSKASFSRRGLLISLITALGMAATAFSRAEPAEDKYLIQFASDVDLDGLTVNHAISGKEGGMGIRILERVESPVFSLDVHTAKTLKVIVMSPHYKTVLIDVPDLEKDAARRTKVDLEPLANVSFRGHVTLPKDFSPEHYRLEATYYAVWGMRYFGYIDGSPPCFVAGQADLHADGSFEMTLPDMIHDPVIGKRRDDGFLTGFLTLMLRHKKSGNLPFQLLQKKDDTSADELKLEEHYEFLELRAVDSK